MQKLLSVIVAVGLAVAFAGPGFAASKVPTTKAGCVKAHMKWDVWIQGLTPAVQSS
jgi:hypothetical protein